MYHSYGKIRHNRVECDGYKFDSQQEKDYYLVLKNKLICGEIRDIKIHPSYTLQEKFTKNGKNYRKIYYSADFAFYDVAKSKYRVIDVKGFETPVFKLKHKLFEYKYPMYELELMRKLKSGWTSAPKKRRSKKSIK